LKFKRIHLIVFGLIITTIVLTTLIVADEQTNSDAGSTRAATDNSYMANTAFIGSDGCSCHENAGYGTKKAMWSQTIHANSVQEPDSASVLGNFSASTILGLDSGNKTIGLNYNATTGNYTITIDNINYTVWRTLGNRQKQLYVTAINNSKYVLPLMWITEEGRWNPEGYNAYDWFNNTGTGQNPPKNTSFDLKCVGCHSTGTKVTHNATSGEWVATYQELNIGCEACHGPGGSHNGNPANIWKPFDAETCGRCHNVGQSKDLIGGEPAGYPIHADGTQTFPGDPIYNYFVDGTARWGDGLTPMTLAQQYPAWNTTRDGGHAKLAPISVQEAKCMECHSVEGALERMGQWDESDDLPLAGEATWQQTCIACHDPHRQPASTPNKQLLRLPREELCVKCHTSDTADYSDTPAYAQNEILSGTTAAGVLGETGGDPGMLGLVDCADCHMPMVATSATEYDRTSHTFKPLLPGDGVTFNMPDTCTVKCHTSMNQSNGQNIIDMWNSRYDDQLALTEVVFHKAETMVNSAKANGTLSAGVEETFQRARYNFNLAGSRGAAVHNPDFVADLFSDVRIRSEEVIDALSKGMITGTVTDNGVPLSSVYVVAGGSGVVTDASGTYVLVVDSMASYAIEAKVAGYGTYSAPGITVGPGETVTHNIALEMDTDNDGIPDGLDTDDDADGLPDVWETNYSLNPKDPSDAYGDIDNDGKSNLQEFTGGTDPTVADITAGPGGESDPNPNIIIVLIVIIAFLCVLVAVKWTESSINTGIRKKELGIKEEEEE